MSSEPHENIWSNLFDTQMSMKDTDTVMDQYLTILPDNGVVALDSLSEIRFTMRDTSSWFDWSRAYLTVDFRIAKLTAGVEGAVEVANSCALVNNGWSLFKDPKFSSNGSVFGSTSKSYLGIATTIKAMAEYSEDYLKTFGTLQGIQPDNGDGGVKISPNNPVVTVGMGTPIASEIVTHLNLRDAQALLVNDGFKARARLSSAGAVRQLILPLSEAIGFLKQPIPLIGIPIEFSVTRNTDYAHIIHTISATEATAQVWMTDCRLWVPQIKPSLDLELRLLNSLSNGEKNLITYSDFYVNRVTLTASAYIRVNIGTSVKRPTRVYVAFQVLDAHSDRLVNGGTFTNMLLTKICCHVNGHQYPTRPYEAVFTAGLQKYARVYHDFLAINSKSSPKEIGVGSFINHDLYGSLYPIFSIDLSKMDQSHFDTNSLSQIEIEASFPGATAGRQMYIVVEGDHTCQIGGTTGVRATSILI